MYIYIYICVDPRASARELRGAPATVISPGLRAHPWLAKSWEAGGLSPIMRNCNEWTACIRAHTSPEPFGFGFQGVQIEPERFRVWSKGGFQPNCRPL